MRSPKLRAAALAVAAVAVASCTDGGDAADLGPRGTEGTVTVGSSDDAASRIEAVIYANALRMAGGPVETRLGLGPGDAAVVAVERGDITVAPALTGALWERYRPGVTPPSSTKTDGAEGKDQWDEQFVAVSGVLPEGLGLGDPTLALDQSMLFVAKAAPPASLQGCEGLAGPVAVPAGSPTDVAERYGCTTGPVTVVVDDASAARAVSDGRAAIAQLRTLSPAAQELSQVADPDGVVPSRAVVPLMRRDGLTVAQSKRLSAVAGALTTVDLAAMVASVEAGEKSPEEVAADWSAENPLN
ncbi:glycine betaine ABC transporter substrate-binding protein [Tsukamurella sp. 1534]|uniref:glycine betaine ABC transporter substrate-binding protein n=1 Tax=Tsukamurella sp. 1534 TaxID=1151061 RepID=UPI0002F2580B|nr:glycine betaine ABC transporter substrate-binding protein [Tsukamurella sp. 1534]